MCDGLGRQFSYSCPNTTLFQQRMLICDHWYMVNCSKSEIDYDANLLIGQVGKHFVEDYNNNTKKSYQRTPRPDLLLEPKSAEYDIIYRTGKAHSGSNKNLVGVSSDLNENRKDKVKSVTPSYFLPSHWSTEHSRYSVTPNSKPDSKIIPNETSQNEINVTEEPVVVNFKSAFKNTTPKFPESVDVNESLSIAEDLLPPLFDAQETFNVKDGINKDDINNKSNDYWKELRRMYAIPDYEFPLDTAPRPNYHNDHTSFEAKTLIQNTTIQ